MGFMAEFPLIDHTTNSSGLRPDDGRGANRILPVGNARADAALAFDEWKGSRLMDIIRIIVAIILPPVGVFMQVGFGKHFWINILLTLLGYIPGIIHAIWVIAKY
jgi:uncharacterized membrane protein YqaE (UPF0057 family)